MSQEDLQKLQRDIVEASAFIRPLKTEMSRIVAGQSELIDRLIAAMLADGHVLLEGLPGLAKTLAVKTLAQSLNGKFARIQFTPDLLPADVVGTNIYNPQEHTFAVKQGPVFANIVLADEINRAPAKVQSALLECMQEKQATVAGTTLKMPEPFLVLATQNPIEQEGTYPLPEAQIDRFIFKLKIDYPNREEERLVAERMGHPECMPHAMPVAKLEDIANARKWVDKIYMDEKILDYILDIVWATRPNSRSGSPEQNSTTSRRWSKSGPRPAPQSRSSSPPKPWRSWRDAPMWFRRTSRASRTMCSVTESFSRTKRKPKTGRRMTSSPAFSTSSRRLDPVPRIGKETEYAAERSHSKSP